MRIILKKSHSSSKRRLTLSELNQLVQKAQRALDQGRCSEAEQLFMSAFELAPHELSYLLKVGRAMMGRGAWREATELFNMVIGLPQAESTYDQGDLYGDLAECYYQLREKSKWLEAAHQSIQVGAPHLKRLIRFAHRLISINQDSEAIRALNRALRIDERSELVHRAFAEIHLKHGDRQRAIQSLSAVAAINPQNTKAISQLSELLNQRVPTWHFPMMNDEPRNQAFEEAILARLEPGDTVLDIGCGAGLLSLMAARGGAKRVIAIEGEAEVADAAEAIFTQNGYEDQIQLVRGRSTSLRLGVDVPEKADLLVSEIFDVSLLGEDALNTFQHAQRELLKPNAKVIPAQARVWCALVESDELRARFHVDDSCGFDLSAFNRLRDPRVLQLDLRRFQYEMLNEPTLVAHFNFEEPIEMMGELVQQSQILKNGRADGFIFWYDLVLAPATEDQEEIALSTAPDQENTHWLQGFAPCYGEARHLEEGSLANILCGYRRFLLWLQLL